MYIKHSSCDFFTRSNRLKSGFTLIELSIVLVIIGLIVGGVLVARDLLAAAQIRSQVAQFEKYSTAVHAFRLKYNALPGDIANPAAFGLTSSGGIASHPNGNGILQTNSGFVGGQTGEVVMFWKHFAESGLDDNQVTTNTYATYGGTAISENLLPVSKLGKSNYIAMWGYNSNNYYTMAGFITVGVISSAGDAITPNQAFQLDSKMDDGKADSAKVVSILSATASPAIGGGSAAPDSSGTDDCYDTDTGEYAVTTDILANASQCQLRINAGF